MTKSSSGSLCTVVARFPTRMTQELAHRLEPGFGNSVQGASELRDSTIRRIAPLCFVSNLRIGQRAPLTSLVNPKTAPVLKKGTRDLQSGPKGLASKKVH